MHVPYEEGNSSSGYLNVPRFITGKESKASETENTVNNIKEYFGGKERTFVLPASYDSRSKVNDAGIPYVMPVRNQGIDSTCWAFSTCSTAETSMIKQNLFQKKNFIITIAIYLVSL